MFQIPVNRDHRDAVEINVYTTDLCSELLKYNYDFNRPLREGRAQGYGKLMEKGSWSPATVKIHFAVMENPDGSLKPILINGQHTLAAQARFTDDSVYQYATAWTFCDNIEQVAKLYSDHDLHRTMNEKLKSRRISETLDLSDARANRLSAAATQIMTNFEVVRTTQGGNEASADLDLRVETMEEYLEEAKIYFSIIDGADTRRSNKNMMQASVMSVAILALRLYRDQAIAFLNAVANPTMNASNDAPAFRLFEYITLNDRSSTAVNVGDKRVIVSKMLGDVMVAIHCFNKHLSMSPIKVVKVATLYQRMVASGLKIDGTTWGPNAAAASHLVEAAKKHLRRPGLTAYNNARKWIAEDIDA